MHARPVPDGYHSVTPHLVVRDAHAALEFYKLAFGAEELVRHPGPDGRSIMHAELRIGDSNVMLSDEYAELDVWSPLSVGGTPVTLHLYVNDVDEAFGRAVRAGARVTMPLADTFWGDRYGQISDPFGHQWSLATRKVNLTAEEIVQGAREAFGTIR
jgi:uncharacterized glyoxalase superfamily protein PhnB